MIRHPRFVIMTQTCRATDPTRPNDSFMSPAYVVASPECVNLIRNSTDMSASHAMTTISTNAGTAPRTLRVAGMDIIPAPIMDVETLKTAPETDAGLAGDFFSGSSGMCGSASGDMAARKFQAPD